MKKNLAVLFLLVAFVFQSAALAQAPQTAIADADRKAVEAVTAKQLSDYLHFVASDEMEGRDTPSRGLDLTAKFIAMNLSRWGFKPAGDNGTFFQKIALGRESPNTAFTISKSAGLDASTKKETVWTQNVVAVWEGSDLVLKNEMVAIGAHYDHVGIKLNAPGDDKIFNGADDDGSGTVGVLAIAEALAKTGTRPKRSVLFVWHCGEEKGLWGSEYFNKFPTVDIKQVVAQLNIDMIGRSRKPGDSNEKNKDLTGPNEVYVIGSEMMSSTLGSVTKSANGSFLKLDYNYRYDDPKDTSKFFFRSDHFHYAKNGIPVVFWFTGVHEDYHRAGDHPDKIDYEKMEKIARTIMMTLLKLADLKERPKIDKQLPPELTAR